MRNVIAGFFIVIILTSFSVLAVSLISKKSFKADSITVQATIYLANNLANVRLTFRDLLIQSRNNISLS